MARGAPARVYDEVMKTARAPAPPKRLELPQPSADLPSKGPPNARGHDRDLRGLTVRVCARQPRACAPWPRRIRPRCASSGATSRSTRSTRALSAAARVTEEARAQKGDAAFWEMVDRFYRDLDAEDAFSDARIAAYAEELGLDAKRLVAAAGETRFDAAIDRDVALGTKAGIAATPTFSVDGYELAGAQPPSAFKRLIKTASRSPSEIATSCSSRCQGRSLVNVLAQAPERWGDALSAASMAAESSSSSSRIRRSVRPGSKRPRSSSFDAGARSDRGFARARAPPPGDSARVVTRRVRPEPISQALR